TFARLIIRNRFAFAESLSRHTTSIDAFLDDVVFHRIDAAFRQTLIVSFRPDVIGIASEINLLIFVLVHEGNQPIQNCPGFRLDVALIEVKEHIIQNNRPLHFRCRWRRWWRWWWRRSRLRRRRRWRWRWWRR